MPHDFVPRPDADLAAWSARYYDAVKDWWTAQGLDTSELDKLQEFGIKWQEAFAAHIAARAAAAGAVETKEGARGLYVPEARRIAAFIQSFPKTTDAERAALGLTVRGSPTLRVGSPTSAPTARVEVGSRLTHTLRFTDNATPGRTAKPDGCLGAEVWLALTDPNTPAPPPNSSQAQGGSAGDAEASAYRFLTLNSRGAVKQKFTTGQAGKTANYLLRWVSTRGEKGPWSEVIQGTVAA